jgi:hypothetical protein
MNTKSALSSVGCVVYLALAAAGCSADAGGEGEDGAWKVAEPPPAQLQHAPVADVLGPKQVPDDSFSPKGSATRPFGNTYMTPVSIPGGGQVACYTTGASPSVDPVLVLFRRHDNQHKTTPYNEQVWVQTLAINDDVVGGAPNDRNSYFSFTNTSGGTLNAYLMAFAYGSSVGSVGLWCTGAPSQNVTLAAGSVLTVGSSGTASTSGSSGDPWLFLFDEPLSYWGNWNDDTNGLESSFSYSGGNRTLWFVAHGWGSGTTTINW